MLFLAEAYKFEAASSLHIYFFEPQIILIPSKFFGEKDNGLLFVDFHTSLWYFKRFYEDL